MNQRATFRLECVIIAPKRHNPYRILLSAVLTNPVRVESGARDHKISLNIIMIGDQNRLILSRLDPCDIDAGYNFSAAVSYILGILFCHFPVVNDASLWRIDRFYSSSIWFDFMQPGRVDHLQILNPVGKTALI